jgi:hypothetical protein
MTRLRLDTFVRAFPRKQMRKCRQQYLDCPSAMQHGLPILTSDRDFQKIPQVIVHHFSPV